MPRSTLYYKPKPISGDDLSLMRRIDEIYTKWPFYGARKMVAQLRGERYDVIRKAVAPADVADGDCCDLSETEHQHPPSGS